MSSQFEQSEIVAPGAAGTMVFHAPYPLRGRTTGSGIRPLKMRDAFERIGYQVLEVEGYGADRRRSTARVREHLAQGGTIDFAYFENSTMPTLLTEPHHLPTHPIVDVVLLRLLRRYGIPTGLFYRDVYWRFPAYRQQVGRIVSTGTKTLYHGELLAYRRWIDRVYLPSLRMASYVPHLRARQIEELPPGGRIVDEPRIPGPFTVLYVGNISGYYRMHSFFEAMRDVPDAHFIICTPEEAWQSVQEEYLPLMGDNVEIASRSGEGLLALFARADACALLVEPAKYRDFAAPVKLFEYIGHGKPVITSQGTYAAEVVERLGAGWSVEYSREAMADLINRLSTSDAEVELRRQAAAVVRHNHTWEARARTVAADLRRCESAQV